MLVLGDCFVFQAKPPCIPGFLIFAFLDNNIDKFSSQYFCLLVFLFFSFYDFFLYFYYFQFLSGYKGGVSKIFLNLTLDCSYKKVFKNYSCLDSCFATLGTKYQDRIQKKNVSANNVNKSATVFELSGSGEFPPPPPPRGGKKKPTPKFKNFITKKTTLQ